MLCRARDAAAHRRFAQAVMGTSPRVLAADVHANSTPVETEVTLSGAEVPPQATLDAMRLYGLAPNIIQDNGDCKKVFVR